jgi:low temperature requirement protein LtrA
MSMPRHPRILAVAEESRVTPIELFFDLVFVFSITQVTALIANDLTADLRLTSMVSFVP